MKFSILLPCSDLQPNGSFLRDFELLKGSTKNVRIYTSFKIVYSEQLPFLHYDDHKRKYMQKTVLNDCIFVRFS